MVSTEICYSSPDCCAEGVAASQQASASAQAALGLAVLGTSFGTKGSLAFLTYLASDSAASQSLVDDLADHVTTSEQVP